MTVDAAIAVLVQPYGLVTRDARRRANKAWKASYRVVSGRGRFWSRQEVLDACIREAEVEISRVECVVVLDDPGFRPQVTGLIPARVIERVVAEAISRRAG